MTTNYYPLAMDADLPGVVTTVKQVVDFAELDPTQLRRCVRAVRRGHIANGGYVAKLVRAAAAHLKVAPPVQVGNGYVYGLLQDKYEPHFTDLIKLSDVRYELWRSQLPSTDWRSRGPGRKAGWQTYSSTLVLPGFLRNDDLKKHVIEVLHKTNYFKELQQLADFIESKPRFEINRNETDRNGRYMP
jgi:hypothetical protein